MNNSWNDILKQASEIKQAFQPMPQDMPPPGMTPGGAPAQAIPGALAQPQPDAAQQGGQAPAGGGSLTEALMAEGIDPNMLMQDQNMLMQVAQAIGMPPEQLMQALQAEMGGAAPMPPAGGAPMDPAAQGGQAPAPAGNGMEEVIPQLMQAVEGLVAEVEGMKQGMMQAQQQNQQLATEFAKIQGQFDMVMKSLKSVGVPA